MGSCNKLEIKYEDFQVPHVKIFTLGTIYTMVELRFETPNLSVFGYTGNVFSWSSCGALSLSEANLHFCSAPKIWFSMVCSQIHWTTRKVPSGFQIVAIAQLALTVRYVCSILASISFIFDWLPHMTQFSFFFFSLCTVHVPADLRQSLHPPLSGAKHLDFTMRLLTNRDFWLWISPHAGTVFRISKQKEIYFPRLCSFFSFKLWKLCTYTP